MQARAEEIISTAGWLRGAQFDTIHYVMRFGAQAEEEIYCRHRPKYQELEVASQLSMSDLHRVFLNRPLLRSFIASELIRVFRYLQIEYELPAIPELYKYLEPMKVEKNAAPNGSSAASIDNLNGPGGVSSVS